MKREINDEAASSDDDTAFAKKEQKRLAKDMARIKPIILGPRGGAPPASQQPQQPAPPQDGSCPPASQQPPPLPMPAGDLGSASAGFSAVGGLADVKRSLHEMVLAPLCHPELFERLRIQPPRGILLHGASGA